MVHAEDGSYESIGFIGSDERKRRSNRPSAVLPLPSSPTSVLRPFYSPNLFSVLSDDPQSGITVKNNPKKGSSSNGQNLKKSIVVKTVFKEGMSYDEWRKANKVSDTYALAQMESEHEYKQIMDYEMQKSLPEKKGKWTATMTQTYTKVAGQYVDLYSCSDTTTEEYAQLLIHAGNSPLAKGNSPNAINQPKGIQPFMYIRDFFVNYYVHVVEAKAKATNAKEEEKEDATGGHLRQAKGVVKEQDESTISNQIVFFIPELQTLMMYLNDWHKFVLSRKYAQHHTTEEIKIEADILKKAVYYLDVLRFYVFNVRRAYYETEEQTLAFLRKVDFDIPPVFDYFVDGTLGL